MQVGGPQPAAGQRRSARSRVARGAAVLAFCLGLTACGGAGAGTSSGHTAGSSVATAPSVSTGSATTGAVMVASTGSRTRATAATSPTAGVASTSAAPSTANTTAVSATSTTIGSAPMTAGTTATGLRSILAVSANCVASLPVAASGGYLLAVEAEASGIRYTVQISTLPLAAPPGVADLVGRVASNIPGTPLSLGSPVFSVVDSLTKPVDVYTLQLRTGQTLRVQASATPAQEVVLLEPPGAAPFTGVPDWSSGTMLCNVVLSGGLCDQTFPIAADGVYTLLVEGDAPGVQYTLQATAK